jgi:hypothetical protein
VKSGELKSAHKAATQHHYDPWVHSGCNTSSRSGRSIAMNTQKPGATCHCRFRFAPIAIFTFVLHQLPHHSMSQS